MTQPEPSPTPRMTARRVLGLILGSALSVLALYLVLRQVSLAEIRGALAAASPAWIALAIASYAASMWAKARRWRLLFYPHHAELRIHKLTSILLIGQMANSWLFTRSGELARAYLVKRIEGTSAAGALGTVVLEKSLESLMLLASLGLLALLMPLPAWLKISSIALSALLVGVLLLLLLAAHQRERLIAWGESLVLRIPSAQRWNLAQRLVDAGNSLRGLARPSIVAGMIAWSAVVWGISTLTNHMCLQAIGISAPWYASLFLMVVFYVGASLPASPGRLGVFHYLAVEALAVLGVARAPALGFAILLHLIAYVLMGIAGAFCLWRENALLQRAGERA